MSEEEEEMEEEEGVGTDCEAAFRLTQIAGGDVRPGAAVPHALSSR